MPDPLSYLSGIGGVMSSVIPLLGSDKSREQFQYQLTLNEIQQRYARENRQQELYNQYRYQYNLPLLNKAGLRAAGYSVAGVEDGNVSSVSTPGTATPSAGAAPTGAADVSAALGVANLLQQLSLTQAQTEKTKEEAKGQKIQNDVDADSAEFDKIARRSAATLASMQSNNYWLYGGKREKALADLAEIQKDIAACEYMFKKPELQLDYLIQKQTLDNLRQSLILLQKNGFKVDAEIEQVNALTRSAEAQTRKTNAETEGIQLDNQFKSKTMDDRVKAVGMETVRSVLDSYPKSVSEAAYALILNPELYPALTKGMSANEIRQLQEINKKLLDVKELSDIILPWR